MENEWKTHSSKNKMVKIKMYARMVYTGYMGGVKITRSL